MKCEKKIEKTSRQGDPFVSDTAYRQEDNTETDLGRNCPFYENGLEVAYKRVDCCAYVVMNSRDKSENGS
jgi:hypothetical protein